MSLMMASEKKRLEEYLVYLKGEKNDEIIKRIDTARGFGDLSENSEYDEARTAQSDNNLEIERIEKLLEEAEVIDTTTDISKISIGHVVTLTNLMNNKTDDYFIVGTTQADPAKKWISNESPLGAALIGKSVGDIASFQVPAGLREYKILNIKLKED